jgi:hypothetical protein
LYARSPSPSTTTKQLPPTKSQARLRTFICKRCEQIISRPRAEKKIVFPFLLDRLRFWSFYILHRLPAEENQELPKMLRAGSRNLRSNQIKNPIASWKIVRGDTVRSLRASNHLSGIFAIAFLSTQQAKGLAG